MQEATATPNAAPTPRPSAWPLPRPRTEQDAEPYEGTRRPPGRRSPWRRGRDADGERTSTERGRVRSDRRLTRRRGDAQLRARRSTRLEHRRDGDERQTPESASNARSRLARRGPPTRPARSRSPPRDRALRPRIRFQSAWRNAEPSARAKASSGIARPRRSMGPHAVGSRRPGCRNRRHRDNARVDSTRSVVRHAISRCGDSGLVPRGAGCVPAGYARRDAVRARPVFDFNGTHVA
jgi:hypothetical protein